MLLSPWTLVWGTAALVLAALQLIRVQGWRVLTPWTTAAAVAATMALFDLGGVLHLLVFPTTPLVVTALGPLGARVFGEEGGGISLSRKMLEPWTRLESHPGLAATVNPWIWSLPAVAAIVVATGEGESAALVLALFPGLPLIAGELGRIGRFTDRLHLAASPSRLSAIAVLAPVVALAVAVMGSGVEFRTSAPTTTTTTVPAPPRAGVFIDVRGMVVQPDGSIEVVPVGRAFLSVTAPERDIARYSLSNLSGHGQYFVEPGAYDLMAEPPEEGSWEIVDGCLDRIEDFEVASAEQWTWIVLMVDTTSVDAYGNAPHCEEPNLPVSGKLF